MKNNRFRARFSRTTLIAILAALALMCAGALAEELTMVETTDALQTLEDGLYAVQLTGGDGFDDFLAAGGASSDMEVVSFIGRRMLFGGIKMNVQPFGCSAFTVPSTAGGRLFGRNFDWYSGETWILEAHPDNGYASIATVNMDFLGGNVTAALPASARKLAAYYAPLDGMNEVGLYVAVLYIEDRTVIDQQTDRPDITTTTAIRMLLNKAATVEEAVDLLGQYDFHASMGMVVHLAIADAGGSMAAVEYVDDEMIVTPTQVLTNFYLAEGEKQGIGSAQSHMRYDTLTALLDGTDAMTPGDVRDALDSVSKHNFNDGETTVWSMVCDQLGGTVTYYHREDYSKGWTISLK